MGAALTAMDFFSGSNRSLVLSLAIHGLLVVLLSFNLDFSSPKPASPLAIQAVLIDPASLTQQTTVAPAVEPAPLPEPEPVVEPEPMAEPDPEPIVEPEPEPKPAPEPVIDQEKLLREKQAKEAAVREAQERDKAALVKRQKDQKAAEQREQERQAAAQRQRDQTRRQQELLAAVQAEEAQYAAQQSGELARYQAILTQRVQRFWVEPASANEGVDCYVLVSLLPSGDVIDARIQKCNGDQAVQRSIEAAVRRASPLPLPDNPALFDRNLRIRFIPGQ
jgi:colicin import membrane protein